MSAEVRLSVALVTRNQPASLRRCLASLRAQDTQPWEIVISDDSDQQFSEATRAVATEFGGRYVTGPRRGLYANRNTVAVACSGTHVRTMDDDHTLPQGHIAECLEAVRRDLHAIWTTGETSFVDGKLFGTAQFASQLHPSGVGGPVHDVDWNWAISDGSTIYPASVFRQGLRMFEEFSFGSSYLEFGAFAFRCGYHSRCLHGALVEHHANVASLSRGTQPSVILSRVWASLCYNLYFSRSIAGIIRYVVPALMSLGVRKGHLVPRLFRSAHRRWRSANRFS